MVFFESAGGPPSRGSGDGQRQVPYLTLDSALHGTDGRIWQIAVTKPQDVANDGCDAGKVLMAWEEELSSRARTLSLVASLLEQCHEPAFRSSWSPWPVAPRNAWMRGRSSEGSSRGADSPGSGGRHHQNARLELGRLSSVCFVLPCPGCRSGRDAERRRLGRGADDQNGIGPRLQGDIRGPELAMATPRGARPMETIGEVVHS